MSGYWYCPCGFAVADDHGCTNCGRRLLTKPDPESTKPPLGLMPRSIWITHRTCAIVAAMHRYAQEIECAPGRDAKWEAGIVEWAREIGEIHR